jgi:hypothetical protein
MLRDQNFVAALEKAIKEKYGEESIVNPKSLWDEEKEQEYQKDLKEAYKKETESKKTKEVMQIDGVLISKKLINKNISRQCKFCKRYSFVKIDDLFLTKYQSCHICYTDNVEDKLK